MWFANTFEKWMGFDLIFKTLNSKTDYGIVFFAFSDSLKRNKELAEITTY